MKKADKHLAAESGNQRRIESEQQQHQEVMQNQDRQMDQVAVTIRNMREIGEVMGEEIDDQHRYALVPLIS